MNLSQLITYLVLFMFLSLVASDDFYDLLGVDRQASSKEIRKAFKKLALTLHPDKNREDPAAHDKFLKVNRAYEVLKDEDLRKKYDMHGEDGLKEDGPSGGSYQSWSFYSQEFGIYDDDPEIITLSRSDFELSVDGTDDVWFINYYSPHCSHCHDLAPTWRELARELFGVIRIGAINCEDDWMLCRQNGIRSYPTLVLYPQKEKYSGERRTRAMVKYALSQVKAQVIELWSGNFRATMIEDKERSSKPCVITYCGGSGDCLESYTVKKLAAMLDELVNVATVQCSNNRELCESLGADHGTWFYPSHKVQKGHGIELDSLEARELAFSVLKQLPDVTELSQHSLQKVLEDLRSSSADGLNSWLIHFTESTSHDLELRKLPALLSNLNVGRVDCRLMRTDCNSLHIHKFPTFVMFKKGGGHEFHYGRLTAHDIAAFARDSSQTPVTVLGPTDFPAVINDHTQSWFIDFFAPWCPPCMRLLPEFRKASRQMPGLINFGTVDCTEHTSLCQSYNIRSYPTTILYNHSSVQEYHGHHSANYIVEFLQDMLDPPVQALDSVLFDTLVGGKSTDEIWLVDFFAPWCGPCQQLAPEWRKLAKMIKNIKGVRIGSVDCESRTAVCTSNAVRSYPTIRLYPTGATDSTTYHTYNSWHRDAASLRAWLFEFLPSSVVALDRVQFYDKVLRGVRPWVVDFYAPWCSHCQVFAPEFERVASTLEGRVSAGKVNCDVEGWLCQEVGVRAYPTLRFYTGASDPHTQQHAYGEDLDSQNGDYIIQLLSNRLPTTATSTTNVRPIDEL